MNYFCGLDFGTSNSTVGLHIHNQYQLVLLENQKPSMRSAIFTDIEEKQWVFGQTGINRYLEGNPGRLMMSIKSVLGSALMEEKTVIFNQYVPYTHVLKQFLRHIKSSAEQTLNHEITQVVLGRPVYFHDHDQKKDLQAQNTLETLAYQLGFKEVSFQYEPIAAALAYELSINEEKLAMIIDIGGGTSDFTIIRLHPQNKLESLKFKQTAIHRSQDVLANSGIHIAGTDFDQRLNLYSVMPLLGMGSLMKGSSSDIEVPAMIYHDLTTWHTLNQLYEASQLTRVHSIQTMAYNKLLFSRLIHVLKIRAGHHILDAVETAKQQLSHHAETILELCFIEDALNVPLSRVTFNAIIEEHLQSILEATQQTVKMASIKFSDINALFYTGGSTQIPIIRKKINALFPQAEVIQGDAFGSVGLGLTIDAHRKFGLFSES